MLQNKNMVGKILCAHERRVLRHRQVEIASRIARSESDSNTPDFTRIKFSKLSPFLVSTWYRPPSSPPNLFSEFENVIAKIDEENKELYLLGDIN